MKATSRRPAAIIGLLAQVSQCAAAVGMHFLGTILAWAGVWVGPWSIRRCSLSRVTEMDGSYIYLCQEWHKTAQCEVSAQQNTRWTGLESKADCRANSVYELQTRWRLKQYGGELVYAPLVIASTSSATDSPLEPDFPTTAGSIVSATFYQEPILEPNFSFSATVAFVALSAQPSRR